MQLQISALAILPYMPAHKLKNLLGPDVRLLPALTRQLRSANKEVASASITAVGQFISSTHASEALATVKDVSATIRQWAEILVEGMMDSTPAVSAAAFGAVRSALRSSLVCG